MFDFVDRRTEAERTRDLEWAERRQKHGILARGFLEQLRRKLATDESLTVGLVGTATFCDGGELLVQSDGITYRVQVVVALDE